MAAKEKELTDYSQHLSSTFESSIALQDTFAHALDDMFTKEFSVGQFATILKEQVIEQSRQILDAVSQATSASEVEGGSLDIITLRERQATLKQEYLMIVNTWKNGGVTQSE